MSGHDRSSQGSRRSILALFGAFFIVRLKKFQTKLGINLTVPPEYVKRGEPWLNWIIHEINGKWHDHYTKYDLKLMMPFSEEGRIAPWNEINSVRNLVPIFCYYVVVHHKPQHCSKQFPIFKDYDLIVNGWNDYEIEIKQRRPGRQNYFEMHKREVAAWHARKPAELYMHHRMPVILGNMGSTEEWPDGCSSSKFSTVLKPYEEPDLIWYPVTSAMNKPSYDGPECIREIQLKTEEMKPISSFFSKKVCKSDESKPQVTNATPALTLKVEPDTEGNMADQQSLVHGSNEDVKSNVAQAQLANRDAYQFQLKRDYEQYSAQEKSSVETNHPHSSPARKKGNLGGSGAGSGQKSLFSYLGKG